VLAFLSRFEIIHEIGSWSVENVTTGIQNLLICFEMFFVAVAHTRAFPYEAYIDREGAQGPPLRTSLLADHLAIEDAMRDFNEVMPVVLPTKFTPGAKIFKTKRKNQVSTVTLTTCVTSARTQRRNSGQTNPEKMSLLGNSSSVDIEGGEQEMETSDRGWKL
jgi:hypothetical protein